MNDTTDRPAGPPRPRTAANGQPAARRDPADGLAIARDAALWITALARQFPELHTELAPAPGRRGAPSTRHAPLVPDLAERSALRREERREALLNEQRHGLAVPGYGAAPIRLHVSDAIRDVSDGVIELEEAVYDRLGLGRPRRADVPQRLARIGALLGRIAEDATLARHVRDELRRMARRCGRALGEAETMVRLPGRCPWCESVSLRAFPVSRAVVCVNPGCRCGGPECDCATDPAFRHVWAESTWPELAEAAGLPLAEIAARLEAPAAAAGTVSGGGR
ncbi:hypothetical protein [Streptomyces lichenis]|uniref:Uncharacterized protein n=1 Tax=Streptomyces lichenis TaxID=2306967 RepID=A0ABT0IGA1_9ACTN|nr:hypothetical protein [Streptomyces lichenis]MCK8680326.1 hypothetical protein [Streptomyces lichenis]